MATTATATNVNAVKKESQLRTNLNYLIKGKNSPIKPTSLQTRTTLRTVRYIAKFLFWRLLRYFKYAAIAAGGSMLAGTFIGTSLPILASILVPSVPVAAAIGVTTAAIKFSWRHRGNHFRGWNVDGDARKDESKDANVTIDTKVGKDRGQNRTI